jgi:ATP-binding cassette subfamily F protein 3
MVVWQQPNLLVLDEPTNHLDLDMRHAMEVALQSYEGALVLVSHDRHMLRNTVEELLLVHDGTVAEYRETLSDYESWILSRYRQTIKAETSGAAPEASRKEKRQQAASRRNSLRPLQKGLEKTEREMTRVNLALEEIQSRLGDSNLYAEDQKEELAALLRQEGELKVTAEQLDEDWLDQQQQLEELQGASQTT